MVTIVPPSQNCVALTDCSGQKCGSLEEVQSRVGARHFLKAHVFLSLVAITTKRTQDALESSASVDTLPKCPCT